MISAILSFKRVFGIVFDGFLGVVHKPLNDNHIGDSHSPVHGIRPLLMHFAQVRTSAYGFTA